MATRYVWSGAAGAGTGADWTNAYTTLAAALAASTSADLILVAHDHAATQTTAKTLTFPTSPGMVAICVDRGTGALATTGQEAIGAGSVAFNINGNAYVYGIEFFGATNNSSSATIGINNNATASTFTFEACKFRLRTANASTQIIIGVSGNSSSVNLATEFRGCEFGFAATGQTIQLRSGRHRFIEPALYTSGTAPTSLFSSNSNTYADVQVEGGDLSGLAWTNLISPSTSGRVGMTFSRTKLRASYTAINASTASPQVCEVLLLDCANGDVHTDFAYANCLGTLVSDTGIKTSAGSPDPGASWKIVTTANASFGNPFIGPWIDRYNDTLSAITPRIEILRDGSTTAFTDAQVWGEFTAKVTTGSVGATLYSDRQALGDYAAGTAASSQAAGAGLSSWTGESGTAWSGKVETTASITPAEVGAVRGRVVVAAASATVYVEPVVRW